MTDFADRYEAIRTRAQAVNHELRVIVAPGRIEIGQQLTVLPFEAEGLALEAALDRIEEYLESDAAIHRGLLYGALDQAKDDERAAWQVWQAASDARRAAVRAIEDDTNDALDVGFSATAGDLRKDLATVGGPEADAALEEIAHLPDDAVVDVAPE